MNLRKILNHNILLICILLFCFILIETFTTGRGFFFTSLGWVDHWLYLGHFEFTPIFEPSHLANYKSSRLLWVWQGHLIFKFLGFPLGHYFIVIFGLFKYWLSFWLVAKEYVENKRYIFICMSIFMFYPTLKQNGGWYYHNLEASSWWLLAIYFLRLIEKEKISTKFLFLSGLFAGFAINTNLFFINFLPIFIFLTPKLFFKNKFLIFYALIGLLGSVLLIGLVNLILGGNFEYYQAMIRLILEFRGASELFYEFVNTESFKLFMLLNLFSGVVIFYDLWIYKKTQNIEYRPLVISFLFTSYVYLFWHIRGVEVLSVDIHNSMLLVIGFLMLMKVGESVLKRSPSLFLTIFTFFFSLAYSSLSPST